MNAAPASHETARGQKEHLHVADRWRPLERA
jgi:hypothetical protein